jgi:hypothetical protein
MEMELGQAQQGLNSLFHTSQREETAPIQSKVS